MQSLVFCHGIQVNFYSKHLRKGSLLPFNGENDNNTGISLNEFGYNKQGLL